jgi:hypothetical protein
MIPAGKFELPAVPGAPAAPDVGAEPALDPPFADPEPDPPVAPGFPGDFPAGEMEIRAARFSCGTAT